MILQASAQAQLRQYIEQLERIDEEKRALAEDRKEKVAEIKAAGFDAKIIDKILKMRRKSAAERDEEQAMLDTYLQALGMQGSFEFSEAAE